MAEKYFRPSAGRYGAHPEQSAVSVPSITANTTTLHTLATARSKFYVERLAVVAMTVVADADGSALATITVHRAGASVTTLATSFNLEAAGLTAGTLTEIPFDSGVTDNQRILLEGDFLLITITNNSAAIDTQPVGLRFAAELLALR